MTSPPAGQERPVSPIHGYLIDGLAGPRGIRAARLPAKSRDLLPVLAGLALWGCSSTQSAAVMERERWLAVPPLPYSVCVVLPGSPPEEAGLEGSPQGILRLDPDRLAKSLESQFLDLRVSSDFEVVTPAKAGDSGGRSEGSSAGSSDRLERFASSADLLLELDPAGEPTYAFAYRNGWFFPNTFLWFLAGFPSFWIADRVYAVRWDLTLKVSLACARGAPQTVRLSLDEEKALSISEQGWTATALYTPPGFYEGPQAARSLSHLVEEWIVEEIVGFLKSESGKVGVLSSLSDVDIRVESPQTLSRMKDGGEAVFAASIESPTLLERLRVEVDGAPALELSPLNMPKASRVPARGRVGEAFEYKVRLPIEGSPGQHGVRVFALRGGEPAARGLEPGTAWSASRTIRFTVEGDSR